MCIRDRGYDYPVKVELTNMHFNTRVYETVTLPAGEYDALRVSIGEAQGHNWWCVMFPPMCLPAAEESKELQDVLDPAQMEIVEAVSYTHLVRTSRCSSSIIVMVSKISCVLIMVSSV